MAFFFIDLINYFNLPVLTFPLRLRIVETNAYPVRLQHLFLPLALPARVI